MSDLEKISFKLDKELLSQLRNTLSDTGISEFIRQAIKKQLGCVEHSAKEFTKMMKQVEQLETQNIEHLVGELLVKQQIMFDEIQKQNAILKLIHRRTTFASVFAMNALDDLKKDTAFRTNEQNKLVEVINKEVKEIEI